MIADGWARRGLRPLHIRDYTYRAPDGTAIVRKRRFALMKISDGSPDGKTFSVQHRSEDSIRLKAENWEPEIGPWGNGLLYRRPELDRAIANGADIAICEGEKDADSVAEKWGVASTTHYQGSAGWRSDQADVLKGFLGRVFIIMDNDKIGVQIAWRTYEQLSSVGLLKGQYQFLAPAEDYDDVSDHIAGGALMWDMEAVPDHKVEAFINRHGRLARGRNYGYGYRKSAGEREIVQALVKDGWRVTKG